MSDRKHKELDVFKEGETFGDYLIGRVLGQGSFGLVKIATNMRTNKTCAIKIVNKGGMDSVEDVERIYREVMILTNLKHRNIIRLFEVFDVGKAIMLSMEYAGGGELHGYWEQKGRLKERETCQIFHQIVAGVEFCHRLKVIHRDLKLENILLDEKGTIKIADFGLSNSIKFGQKLGTNCGTPSYSSPEQVRGEDYVGGAADIWSLGVILYTLLVGFLPFEADNLPTLFKKIQCGLFSFPSYVSKECQDLISKMMTVDATKRITIPEIRQHPWFLMDYSELAETIDALPEVTTLDIREAHMTVLTASGEDLKALDQEKRAAFAAKQKLLRASSNEEDNGGHTSTSNHPSFHHTRVRHQKRHSINVITRPHTSQSSGGGSRSRRHSQLGPSLLPPEKGYMRTTGESKASRRERQQSSSQQQHEYTRPSHSRARSRGGDRDRDSSRDRERGGLAPPVRHRSQSHVDSSEQPRTPQHASSRDRTRSMGRKERSSSASGKRRGSTLSRNQTDFVPKLRPTNENSRLPNTGNGNGMYFPPIESINASRSPRKSRSRSTSPEHRRPPRRSHSVISTGNNNIHGINSKDEATPRSGRYHRKTSSVNGHGNKRPSFMQETSSSSHRRAAKSTA